MNVKKTLYFISHVVWVKRRPVI